MKKLFTLVAAAFISVAMFAVPAVVPTDDQLASYATETYTMCIYNADACNGIVLNGTYAGWPGAADHATLLDFQPVQGFEGWYIVSWNDTTGAETKDGGVQAKPIQLDGSGNFNWDYQLGPDAELIRGGSTDPNKPTMNPNGAEVDIKNLVPGIVVIEVKSWKNNPCTAVYKNYSITLVSPDCNEEDYITPAISGGFNGWAQEAMTMNELKTKERQNAELPGAVFEYSMKAAVGSEFKFRSAAEWGKDWTNELKAYDAEEDAWTAFNGGANLVLGDDTVLVFDLGDPELYSWNNCEKPEEEDTTKYYTIVTLNAPAGAPAAGVEIIGTFDGWAGTAMELLETGSYFVELEVLSGDEFKFREAGTWANEIVYAASGEGLANMKFKDQWQDDTYKDTPCKKIELNFSGEEYVWKANYVEGIENVVLTEKAQKVVIDGVLYIVRDNKMFNVQGAQVR